MAPLAAASDSYEEPQVDARPKAFPHVATGGVNAPLFDFTPFEGMSPTEEKIYKQVFDRLTDSLSKRLEAVEKDCTAKLQSME